MYIAKQTDTLCHSDTYLGKDFSDGIQHWKYIKREKMPNGKWRYYYKNDELDKLENAKLDALNRAMRENTKYSEVGTKYENGKTIHFQVEKSNYSKDKADRAWARYKKISNKFLAKKIADIPRKLIGNAISWIANTFQNGIGTKHTINTRSTNIRFK
jgi:hypothetical protein